MPPADVLVWTLGHWGLCPVLGGAEMTSVLLKLFPLWRWTLSRGALLWPLFIRGHREQHRASCACSEQQAWLLWRQWEAPSWAAPFLLQELLFCWGRKRGSFLLPWDLPNEFTVGTGSFSITLACILCTLKPVHFGRIYLVLFHLSSGKPHLS